MGARNRQRVRRVLASVCAALALWGASPAAADWMWLGGGEGVFDGAYAYTVGIFPFDGELGSGFVHRYRADYIRYEYPVNDHEVEAEGWSVGVALGYQVPITNGWLSMYVSGNYRDTRFSPRQPDSPLAGRRFVPGLEADGGRLFGDRWLTALTVSYLPEDEAYWTRARVLRRTTAQTFLGPEVVAHGDQEYDARQIGLALQLNQVFGRFDVVIKGGGKEIRDGDSGGYGGIELLRHFQ